jgi:hypothetical protein
VGMEAFPFLNHNTVIFTAQVCSIGQHWMSHAV